MLFRSKQNEVKKFWNNVKSVNKKDEELFLPEQINEMQSKYKSYFYTENQDNRYDKKIIESVENNYLTCKNEYFVEDKINDDLKIDEGTINFIIKNMNNSNALGYDGISMNMVKHGLKEIYPLITRLMNLILKFNIFQIGRAHV